MVKKSVQTPKLFLRKTERVVEQGMPEVSEKLLPVEVLSRNVKILISVFNFSSYFARLQTRQLGHVIVYVPVATTTMDINESLCDAIPTCHGAVVVAGRQVSGKGRGGNEFVSPLGAAMFTFSTCIPQSSSLARTPSFIQHIFAVAVVDAYIGLAALISLQSALSQRKENYVFPPACILYSALVFALFFIGVIAWKAGILGDFSLRIKWPNDFYFNRSHKVGGLLATAKSRDDGLLISIGAGINVTNSRPTVCLNDMVPDGMSYLFSNWLNMCEIKGQTEVLKTYYKLWLHSREEITIEHLSEKVVIRGLDQCGFLQVRSKTNPSQSICSSKQRRAEKIKQENKAL
ncbi:Biotin/lipoate A/B protein ligase [Parelaphostrongylus tenuis]|uniref:Biotin/lipoate A/B protein ligase n=1 Tax=Parelaphostrongylus tenuis TaxID=148309 RepID=A0AAD5WG68_PARTN|nr:Biotin/lipoate A/B protein ligase [Parelaphostrongylus tenuis]